MTLPSYWSDNNAADPLSDRQYRISSNYYGDRGDSSGSGWASSFGSSKSKKAEKKQAAMSALTLIAFLFFLNILQNCLKDQKEADASTVVMLNAKLIQGRDPQLADDQELQEKVGEEEKEGVMMRKLLSVHEDVEDSDQSRRKKFIHDFQMVNRDWTNELTPVSDVDIVEQNLKLDKLREAWNQRKRDRERANVKKHTLEEEVMNVKVKKFVNNPVLSDIRSIPKLSQYWELQRTSTTPEPIKYVEFEEPTKKMADFHEFQTLQSTTPALFEMENSLLQNAANNLKEKYVPPPLSAVTDNRPVFKPDFLTHEATGLVPLPTAEPYIMEPVNGIGVAEPVHEPNLDHTPRYRRGSADQSTTSKIPLDELFYPEANQVTPVPAESTTRTFHVYTHPSQMHSGMWPSRPYRRPTSSTTPSSAAPKFNIDSIYLTTARPDPQNVFDSRYPTNHRPYYSSHSRFEYSPNRRVSMEPTYLRHEYYPMSEVGQYGGDQEGPTAGILQLLWSLITSFARPIVSLVPNASKVGRESPCMELMACEAHRFGKYMGPTAQVLATTLSSIMRWISPEAKRSAIDEAMVAARQDTCVSQIETCDFRSGGKSMLTTLAKMLERKTSRAAGNRLNTYYRKDF